MREKERERGSEGARERESESIDNGTFCSDPRQQLVDKPEKSDESQQILISVSPLHGSSRGAKDVEVGRHVQVR